MIYRITTACAALLLPALASAQENSAAAFGARDSVEAISLSPDGSKLAYVSPIKGQGSALYVVDLTTGQPRLATAADGEKQRLSQCRFVATQRLVCTLMAMIDYQGEIVPVSRVVAINDDGSDLKLLSQRDSFYAKYGNLWGGGIIDWLPDENGAVLMGRQHVPELRQNTRIEKKEEGYGVDRIDTLTGASNVIEEAKRNAIEYITDGRGRVRIMGMQPPQGATGMAGRTIDYFYRRKGSDAWEKLGTYDVLTEEGINPSAVDADLDVLYAFKKTNGRQAVYRIALDGSRKEELIFAHPQVDVASLMRIGRRNRVVGVSFVTDRRETIFFDTELKRLASSLSKALPGLPLVSFVDSSADESKLLLHASSDVDPGRYYLYDKKTKRLEELMVSRPQLEGVKLAEVQPITYRASDGASIPGYLTLPPGKTDAKGLPALVMPHGGPSARDEWGFDWLAQYFASRGYAVLQPNFRGSAGYGDEWFQENGFQSWRVAVGDVADAGRWLVSQGIADPAKLAILGWSYGGYAALQSGVIAPDLFKAIVAIAPVTDLNLLKEQYRRWSSFALARDFIGSGPHIQEGSPAQNAASIKAPVLMFHGDHDLNVRIVASTAMKDRLQDAGKKVQLVVYPKLDHYLDDSGARTDMLSKSDAFLRATMGM